AAVAHQQPQLEGPVREDLAGRLELEGERSQVDPRAEAGDHQDAEHHREHDVERVVTRVGGGDADEQAADNVTDADAGGADALGYRPVPPTPPLGGGRPAHSGTGREATTRSRAARVASAAAPPPWRSTTRWASTGTASRCTSSGTAKRRPSHSASACTARKRLCAPRVETPSRKSPPRRVASARSSR